MDGSLTSQVTRRDATREGDSQWRGKDAGRRIGTSDGQLPILDPEVNWASMVTQWGCVEVDYCSLVGCVLERQQRVESREERGGKVAR